MHIYRIRNNREVAIAREKIQNKNFFTHFNGNTSVYLEDMVSFLEKYSKMTAVQLKKTICIKEKVIKELLHKKAPRPDGFIKELIHFSAYKF